MGGDFGLSGLNVTLDLQHVALAEHLGTLNQLVADLSRPSSVNQRVLVLAKLRLQRANL